MKQKTYVEDVSRGIYDEIVNLAPDLMVNAGLTPEIVTQISKEKNDPEWMLEHRLKSLELYHKIALPNWGLLLKILILRIS